LIILRYTVHVTFFDRPTERYYITFSDIDFYLVTACNAMHGIAVAILSVCPAVCQTRVL